MAGITTPSRGKIRLDGTDLFALPEANRDRVRAAYVGYVFQTFNLLAPFTTIENVLLAMLFASILSKREERRRAAAMLSTLGLGGSLSHRPHQLSRGELPRVAMARALVYGPPVILADEPCTSLDPKTARVMLSEFLTLCREERKTLLVVSHEEQALRGAAGYGRGQSRRGGLVMTLFAVALTSLRGRLMASLFTACAVALGVALVLATVLLTGGLRDHVIQGTTDVTLLLGAKGSPTPLVWHVIVRPDVPPPHIPHTVVEP